jgi:hypothetical protein
MYDLCEACYNSTFAIKQAGYVRLSRRAQAGQPPKASRNWDISYVDFAWQEKTK